MVNHNKLMIIPRELKMNDCDIDGPKVTYEINGKEQIFDIPFHFHDVDDIVFIVNKIQRGIYLPGILCLCKDDYHIDKKNRKLIFYKQLKKGHLLVIRRKQKEISYIDKIVYELYEYRDLEGIFSSLDEAKEYALNNNYNQYDIFKVVLDKPDEGVLKRYRYRA